MGGEDQALTLHGLAHYSRAKTGSKFESLKGVSMEEKFIKLDDAEIFVLKTDIKPDRRNLVFVHGIGESLICFSEAFRELDGFNIIALDNAGFGQSKPASSEKHGTIDQAKRAFAVLDALNISNFVLLGHSWGGDIGTFMCMLDADHRIEKYINIESDLHRDNIIMSMDVSRAFSELSENQFEIWLKASELPANFHASYKSSFPQTIFQWPKTSRAASLRYLVSLRMCNSRVYGETATEIVGQHKAARADGVITWGEKYAELKHRTVYCWGTESLSERSDVINFLETNKVPHQGFRGGSHWVMMDCSKDFYEFVLGFITN